MKTMLFVAATLALSTGTALTQHHGSIGIFADSIGYNCDLWDTASGPCVFHVVNVNTAGSAGAEFMAPKPSCFAAVYLGDDQVFAATTGDSQNGVNIAYGPCHSGAIHILDIKFFCNGLTPHCCMYNVVGSPASESGLVEIIDCEFNVHTTGGWTSTINPIPSCCCSCLPVQESTWGKVKSLYGR